MSLPQSITIKLQEGCGAGAAKTFDQNREILIGKDARCDFVVEARGVSRIHCRLEHNAVGWQVIDMKSTNGTFVGDSSIGGIGREKNCDQPIPLTKRLETIRIGEATLEIILGSTSHDRTEVLALDELKPRGEPSTSTFEKRQSPKSQSPPNSKTITSANSDNPFERNSTHIFTELPAQPVSNAEPGKGKSTSVDNSHATIAHVPADECPKKFRNLQLHKSIGIGGMGQVFLATDLQTRKQVAIKFLKSQFDQKELDRARFLREMEIASSLKHASIVNLLDCGDENGQLFITMEYCNGGNLAELLSRTVTLPLRRAVRLLDRLLAGVELAHASGIVHRDLKPQNILLHRDLNGKFKPKISDFGLAKSYLQAGESGMTVNGTVGGSWAYMPREQLTNFRFVSPSSDVWSMGAMFYESITGRLPREHKPGGDPIKTILNSEITPIDQVIPGLPQRLSAFIEQCLHENTEQRFEDAAIMRQSLRSLAVDLGIDL